MKEYNILSQPLEEISLKGQPSLFTYKIPIVFILVSGILFSPFFMNLSHGQFKTNGRTENQIRVSSTIAPDKNTVTLLFDNLEVDFAKYNKGPGISTQQVSYWLPLTEREQPYEISFDLRGHIALDRGSRALLLLTVGAKIEILEWPGNEETNADIDKTIISRVPSGSDLQITIFLLVERNSRSESPNGRLAVDSLDIVILNKTTPGPRE